MATKKRTPAKKKVTPPQPPVEQIETTEHGEPIDPPAEKEPGPESTPDPSTGTGGSNMPNAVNPRP